MYIFSGFGVMYQEKSGNPDHIRLGKKPRFGSSRCTKTRVTRPGEFLPVRRLITFGRIF
jgi:hypothetical protein